MGSSAIFVSCLAVLATLGPVLSAPLQRQESLNKIEALKTKLEDLHKVLGDLENDLSVKEARELSQNVKLADFENRLSQSDRELLDKMKSKVKYLKSALDNPPAAQATSEKREQDEEAVDNELLAKYPSFAHFVDAAKASVRTGSESTEDKRSNEDPNLEQLMEHLTADDKDLIQKHPSQLNAVKAALLSKHDEASEEKKENTIDKTNTNEEQLLEDLKSKLSEIKSALDKEREDKCKNDPTCYNQPPAKIKEGKFGDFVKINKQDQEKEISSNWMQTPIDEVPASEKCKPGVDCECKDGRCNKDDTISHNEKKCKPGVDCECKDGRCNKDDTISHNEKVQKMKKKLLDDVANAKSNGVSTSDLLKALMNARRGV